MAENYVLLETIELTQTAASVTFDNIPQSGYTDLKVVASARTDDPNTGTIAYIKFNGSSSTYSSRYLQGRGDSTASGTGSTSYGEIGRIPGVNSPVTNSVFSNTEIIIPNYLSSNNKSYSVDAVTEANQTIAYAILTAGLWSTSSAITSILVASTAGNLVAGSTFSLYGIAATGTTPATAPKATGGNIVANDGTYWYHAFTTSGTFTPQTPLTCSALVVGGGGGNGGYAGGGGAGGLVYSAINSLTITNYAVTIGAGGAARTASEAGLGNSGSNTTFNSLTAGGGGGGGSDTNINGANGAATNGSGGGGGYGSYGGTGNGTGGNGGAGNGAPGGTVANYSSGGGGGAGANGANATAQNGGNGGAGLNTYSSWATATTTGVSGYYAGGGGGANGNGASGVGGTGGAGGGGNGHKWNTGGSTSGVANTGGGGGGNSQLSYGVGGAGGSGIVIIRYPMA